MGDKQLIPISLLFFFYRWPSRAPPIKTEITYTLVRISSRDTATVERAILITVQKNTNNDAPFTDWSRFRFESIESSRGLSPRTYAMEQRRKVAERIGRESPIEREFVFAWREFYSRGGTRAGYAGQAASQRRNRLARRHWSGTSVYRLQEGTRRNDRKARKRKDDAECAATRRKI